jgi:hypothetical protein
MPDTPELEKPSRYMTFAEVARELQVSVTTVRDKALRPGSPLRAVDIGNGSDRAVWRIGRDTFLAYCEQVERESAARFVS